MGSEKDDNLSDFDPREATVGELADWLAEKEEMARVKYQSGGPGRVRDVHLGRLRAYKDAKRVVLEMDAYRGGDDGVE